MGGDPRSMLLAVVHGHRGCISKTPIQMTLVVGRTWCVTIDVFIKHLQWRILSDK